MGKASKWFRGLLGLKKTVPSPNENKKWSFVKPKQETQKPLFQLQPSSYNNNDDQTNLNLQPTTKVSSVVHVSRSSHQEYWAAVKIQSHFRAYLSRRALRALKALVKLQALVRGHLMRKRTADALRQLQALVRAQTRARVGRVLNSDSPQSSIKSSHFNYHGPDTPEKIEHVNRSRSMKHEQPMMMLKRNCSVSNGSFNDMEKSHLNRIWMESQLCKQGSFTRTSPSIYDEKRDKILEVDSGKPKRRNLFHSSHLSLGSDQNCQSFSTSKDSTARSGEVQSSSPLEFTQNMYESGYYCTGTANNTPTKSDASKSYLSGFSDNNNPPSYMGYTESSKAKLRSLSAPRQRSVAVNYERTSPNKRHSVHGYGESRSSTQRIPENHANFTNRVYPGSGRLDRLGMPVIKGDQDNNVVFSGGLWNRY